MNELCRLSAVAAVDLLKRGEVTPLELVEAAAQLEESLGISNRVPIDPMAGDGTNLLAQRSA